MSPRHPKLARNVPAESGLGRKLAALAGATSAVAAGTVEAVPYTPTAGVAAAQGIPGFSFVSSTNVSLGSLRPHPETGSSTYWDIDGDGTSNFSLANTGLTNSDSNTIRRAVFSAYGMNDLMVGVPAANPVVLANLATNVILFTANRWSGGAALITSSGVNNIAGQFPNNVSGQFGFSFLEDGNRYYGWGSMVVNPTGNGDGFTITEAYYQGTPWTQIAVGQVPQAVPEPSSIALLAIGAAGVTAWRARRKQAE